MCNNYMHSAVKRQYSDAFTGNCFIMVLVDKALLCKGRVKCVLSWIMNTSIVTRK